MPPSSDRPSPGRRSRGRFVLLVLLVGVGLQVPIVAGLARVTGHGWPIALGAGALTAAFVYGLVGRRTPWATPGPARLYLVLWPFFVWWTASLLFAFAAPVALALRPLLAVSTPAVLSGTLAVIALGTVVALSHRPRVRARDIAIEGLPEAFDGYRIAQISDLHCGPFASGRRVAAWVAAVNRLDPDLVAVTGDLIASGADFVPVVAAALGALTARDGVYASMGNHDYFTDAEALVRALEQAGLAVLRNSGVTIRRGGAALYVAGVDDTWTRRHDIARALAARPPETPVVLLAHDPALFPDAAAHGVDLMLSGHTHGGQIAVPLLARRLNLARLMTRFTTGLYQSGPTTLYVNRGLGTTGPPVRLAVAPEIAVLTLRRARGGARTATPADRPLRAAANA